MVIAIAQRRWETSSVTPTGDAVMLVGPDEQLGKLEGEIKSRGV